MRKLIIYKRVSTGKQQKSGLGLEVQNEMIKNFIKEDDEIIAEFTEIESGRNNNRPILKQAIEITKKHDGFLVIAKIDRLTRNIYFIEKLKNSGVKFIATDMPEANNLTINILSAIAQNESDMIRERTKQALQQAKKRGVILGRPENLTEEAKAKGKLKMRENAFKHPNNLKAGHIIVMLRNENKSFYKIAKFLNLNDYKTRQNNNFSVAGTKQLFTRYKDHFKLEDI